LVGWLVGWLVFFWSIHCDVAGATIDPKNAEEFNTMAKAIAEKVTKFETKKEYPVFVENLTRLLCLSMKAEDIKRVATALTAVATEKQKAKQVDTKKKPVPSKKQISSLGGFDDDYTYADDDKDDYDFM